MSYISILIPIYNGIEFLVESVTSVINQTYDKWELIIGINGHPPNSKVYNITIDFVNKQTDQIKKKIKVYDLIGIKGKSNALNNMIQYSNYDHVAILDVDDKWLPEKLEKQSVYLDEYDVVGTHTQYFGDKNNTPNIPIGDLKNFNFLKSNPIINSSIIIRKELSFWKSEYDIIEDYELWLRLWKNGCKFYNIGEVLTLHRIHNTSFFNTNKKQQIFLKKLRKIYVNK